MSIDLTQRLLDSTVGALELFAVHIGRRLGLYNALDRHGAHTPGELAERTGIHPRYAQEWLEQQAVAGYLTVVDNPGIGVTAISAATSHAAAEADGRRYVLPVEHRGTLVDPLDGDHLAPFAGMVVGIAGALDDVVEAYRSGGGVPYVRYGPDFRAGQGGINRPAFTSDLVKSWLPAVDGAVTRLDAGARVVDVGTGHGWSAIAVKAGWPGAEVIGLDTDAASIAEARAHAEQAGVDVRFAVPGAAGDADLADVGPVDLVLVLEALHDMSDPVGVLTSARAALAPDGLVVIADEAVAETFTAPGDDLERMMYGWSVSHCLPAGMAEQPSAALGTALRPATVAEVAAAAGFARCDVVDVDAGFFRLYRLSA